MKSTKFFLLLSLLVAVAMILAACGGQPAEEPMEEPMEEEAMEEETGAIVADEATSTPVVLEEGSAFGEAPMLAEMVAAGDLPPVEERLPVADDIMVVSGVDGIGEYGGTWPLLS
jgi:peptide/nickel transport system substrate-binding protein